MGLHSAPDGGGDPDEEEEEEGLCFTEEPGQGPPHGAEEPIERLASGQNFQLQTVTMTTERCFMNSWTNVSIESVDSFPQPIKGQFWQGRGRSKGSGGEPIWRSHSTSFSAHCIEIVVINLQVQKRAPSEANGSAANMSELKYTTLIFRFY